MNVLITGGAGYIGSTVANLFLDKKHKVSIIDNLSTGKKSNIPKKSTFYKCDISDKKKVLVIPNTNRKETLSKQSSFINYLNQEIKLAWF